MIPVLDDVFLIVDLVRERSKGGEKNTFSAVCMRELAGGRVDHFQRLMILRCN